MHLFAMWLFAFFVAVVFSIVATDPAHHHASRLPQPSGASDLGVTAGDCIRARFRYGIKVFFAFILIGLALAWLMYPIS